MEANVTLGRGTGGHEVLKHRLAGRSRNCGNGREAEPKDSRRSGCLESQSICFVYRGKDLGGDLELTDGNRFKVDETTDTAREIMEIKRVIGLDECT
jgi:hypothetical protein